MTFRDICKRIGQIEKCLKTGKFDQVLRRYDTDVKTRCLLQEYYRYLAKVVTIVDITIKPIEFLPVREAIAAANVEIIADCLINGSRCMYKNTQIWAFKFLNGKTIQISGLFFINMLREKKVAVELRTNAGKTYFKASLEYDFEYDSEYHNDGNYYFCFITINSLFENVAINGGEVSPVDPVNGLYLMRFNDPQRNKAYIKCTYEVREWRLIHYSQGWFPLLKAFPPNQHTLRVHFLDNAPGVITAGVLKQYQNVQCWETCYAHGEPLIYRDMEFEMLEHNGIQMNYFWSEKTEGFNQLIKQSCIEIIDFFTTYLPYPYPGFTFVVMEELTYAACQSGILIFDEYILTNFAPEDIRAYLSHEIAHSWWGSDYHYFEKELLWLYEGIADYWELLYRRKILGQKSFRKRVTDLYDCFQKEEMVEEAAGCLFFVELEKMLGEAAVLEFLITLYQNHRDYLTIIDWERLIIELILDSFKWEYKNDLCCQRYV